MHRFRLFVLLTLFLSLAGPLARAESTVLLVLEMRGLERVAEDLEKLSETLATRLDDGDTVAHIGAALQNPDLEGLDREGIFRFYLVYPEMFNIMIPPVVATAPVTDDGTEALKALSARLKKGKEEGGIHAFKADMPSASLPGGVLFAGVAERRLVMGPNKALVRSIMEHIQLGKIKPEEKITGPGSLAVSLNVADLIQAIEPMLNMQMQMMAAMSASTNAPTPGQPDVAELLQAEIDFFFGFLRQLERVNLTFGLGQEDLTTYSQVYPVPGTLLSSAIRETRQPGDAYRKLIPEDAFYAQAMHWPRIDEFIKPYGAFLSKLYGSMGMAAEDINAMIEKMIDGVMGQLGGDFAFGVLPKADGEGVDFVEVIQVEDPTVLEAIMADLVALQGKMSTKELGYTYDVTNLPARTHRDVKITGYAASMELSDELKKDQPDALLKWYENIGHEMAHVGNELIYVMGSKETMNTMIDRLLDGAGTPINEREAFMKDFPKLKQSPVDMVALSLGGIVKALEDLADLPPAEAGDTEDEEGSDGVMSGCSFRAGQSYVTVSRISLDDLVQLKNASAALLGVFSKFGGMPGAPTSPKPAPAEAP